jgi:hypothetical protein
MGGLLWGGCLLAEVFSRREKKFLGLFEKK